MNTLPFYMAIKARLNGIAPVFNYIGQYTPGKENTAYKAPAIYIQMPQSIQARHYNRNTTAAREIISIHVVGIAPFKNHDSITQGTAQTAHETMVKAVQDLLLGWNITDVNGKLLTQQFLSAGGNPNNYQGTNIFSILRFTTELYERI